MIGPEALANTVATSVGAASTATGIGSFAGGFRATADGRNSIAMSDLSLAYGKGSVAIGERSLAGSTDINSVVKSDEERFSTAVGANAVAAAKQSTALGYNAHALELDSLAINNGAMAFSKESIAIGKDSVAGGAGKDTPTPGALEAIAIGSGAIAQEVQGIAIGSGAVSRGSQGTAIGYNAHALEQDSLAINNGATAFSKESIAIGNDAVAGGIDKNKATTGARRAVAIGGGAVAKDYQGTAIGYKAEAKNTGDVAIGAMSKTPDTIKYTESYNINGEDRTFTGGKNISVMGVASIGDTKSRILTGVAAGQISTVSTDAVNGSQLHRVIEEINKGVVFTDSYGGSATNRFGKNNTVATGDAVTDGDFTGKNLKAVVAAGDAGETTIKLMMNKSPEFENITASKISFGAGGPSITNAGIDAGGKVITNVGDGNIAAGSKDAVNAGQLFDVKETAEAAKNAIDNAKFGLADTKGNKIETGLNNTISVVAGEAKAGANYSVDNLTTVVKDGKLEIQMTDRSDFGGVTINKDGSGRITGVANAVEDGDAVNKKQMDDAIKEASSKVSAGDNNVDVKLDTTGDIKDYKVSLKDDLTLGKDAEKQVSIKGTEGKITAGGVAIDGVNGKINGLKNTTWNGTTSDRGTAATEGQLSDVDTKVEAGWIAQVNGVDAKNVKPSDNKLNFANGSNIEITAGQDGSVKVSTAKDVSFDKVQVGGVSINKDTGIDAGGMKITNIAAGTEAGDAANYGQVKEVSDRVDNLGNAVNRVSNEVQDVGAASAALAGLKPMGYDPMRKTQMMAGVGDYRGNMAVALGIVHYSNEDLMWHVGTSLGASHNMISGGLTFKFGNTKETDKLPARYRKGPMTSVYVLQTEVATLTKQNEYLLKDNQTMKQDNEALKRDNEQLKKDNAETKAKLAMIMAKLGLK